MKTELNESLIYSAYLDSDGSLYLYDKDEKNLEGWPKSWPAHIPCVQTFLKARGINYVNAPAPPTLAEIYGSKADTPPQPAHGEPWEFQEWNSGVNNTIGYGIITHDRDICITVHARRPKGDGINDVNCQEQAQEAAKRLVAEHNLLAPHPDLSAVEVHSKETMDEVRATLRNLERAICNLAELGTDRIRSLGGDCDPVSSTIAITMAGTGYESALAKLNPLL